jgi:hypothetical protein
MRYEHLNRSFPWMVLVHEEQLLRFVTFLTMDDSDVHNGSSFAVTTNVPLQMDGYRWLWLSSASERRLRQSALLAGLTGIRTTRSDDERV